ncbi:MAG: SDR family NAD(P)-dependent oxidoreductase [Armatimonadota bacterium]|nr:SDR family NAD(P)-dependent oxidoreductase [Armatimonadota bacterium]MDR7404797.1 SDR family NAD(P)-dependent oxidoreductase [Armatimonadota bacterium]
MLGDTVAVVTGAAGSLGRETVRACLAEGAQVVAADVADVAAALDLPADLRDRCAAVRADVSTEAGAAAMAEAALARFGRIDALLCLVGGWEGGRGVHEAPLDEWARMLTLNLTTAVLSCRTVLPHMLARRTGRIVTVGSRTAVQPAPRQAAYNAAKAAVVAFSRTLAEEVKDQGIVVTCVLPSILDTEANRRAFPRADPSRWVKPAELARVLAFLASPAAAPLAGAVIPVYGRA